MCAALIEQSPHSVHNQQYFEYCISVLDYVRPHEEGPEEEEVSSVTSRGVMKLSYADTSWHHDACALLMEQLPTALSCGKFLFRQICNLPQFPIMEFCWLGQKASLTYDWHWKTTHHMTIWGDITASQLVHISSLMKLFHILKSGGITL